MSMSFTLPPLPRMKKVSIILSIVLLEMKISLHSLNLSMSSTVKLRLFAPKSFIALEPLLSQSACKSHTLIVFSLPYLLIGQVFK